MKDSRITSRSRATFLALAIASSTILASCGSIRITSDPPIEPKTVPPEINDNVSAARFVPCSQDPILKFHGPDEAHPDVKETAANVYDTPETIDAIRRHNAGHREACGK